MAHRLAVLYMTGSWPENLVDHADGDGLNNRWPNLRDADKSQNGANRGADIRNKLGVKGVRRDPRSGKFSAAINKNGKQSYLGSYATAEEASRAYQAAAAEAFGIFARAS